MKDDAVTCPGWDYWASRPHVAVAEACMLSLGIEPRAFRERDRTQRMPAWREADIARVVSLASAAPTRDGLRIVSWLDDDWQVLAQTTLADFRAWGEWLPEPLAFPDDYPAARQGEPLPSAGPLTQWHLLLSRYRHRDLQKADVIELLRCDVAPPVEVLPMIADILAGEGLPLKEGKRPATVRTEDGFIYVEYQAPQMVDVIAAAYGCGLQAAKREVVDNYGIPMRTLETWRKKHGLTKNKNTDTQ